MKRWLARFALASGVSAPAINVRRLFDWLALGATIFSRRCPARTNWVCILLAFRGLHLFSPSFGSSAGHPGLDLSRQERVFLYRKEHIAISGGIVADVDENPGGLTSAPAFV